MVVSVQGFFCYNKHSSTLHLLRLHLLLHTRSPRLGILILRLNLQTLVEAIQTLLHVVDVVIADAEIMPRHVMLTAQIHALSEQFDACLIITQTHRQTAQIEVHVLHLTSTIITHLHRGQRIEVVGNVHDVVFEVRLHFVARIRNVIHQHLLEFIEHLALIAA